MPPLVLKETRTRNIRPRLSSTSGDVVHQLRDAFLRKNLDLMISSLTAKISRQMSDKCPDIHQALPLQLPTIRQRRRLKRRFSNASVANPVHQEKPNAAAAPFWGRSLRPSSPPSHLKPGQRSVKLDLRWNIQGALGSQNSGPRHDTAANAESSNRRRPLGVISIHHVAFQEFAVNSRVYQSTRGSNTNCNYIQSG